MTSTTEYRAIISPLADGTTRAQVARVEYTRNTEGNLIEDLRAMDYGVRSFASIKTAERSTARYIAKVIES